MSHSSLDSYTGGPPSRFTMFPNHPRSQSPSPKPRPVSNYEKRRSRRFSMKEQNLYIFQKSTLIICSITLCVTLVLLILAIVDKMEPPIFLLNGILAVLTILFLAIAMWSRRKNKRRKWAVFGMPSGVRFDLGGERAVGVPDLEAPPSKSTTPSQDKDERPPSSALRSSSTYKQPKILLFNEIFAYGFSFIWLVPLVVIIVGTIPMSPIEDASQLQSRVSSLFSQTPEGTAKLIAQGVGAVLNFVLLGAFAILLSIERRRNDRSKDDALFMDFVIE